MGYFNRDDSRGGGNSRGGGRSFGGGGRSSFGGRRDDRPREMFKTVCSNCGKDCEVPFRPTTGKPVYCSDCFETMGGRNSDGGRPERPRFEHSDGSQAPRVDNSKQLNELNTKLDKIIELLTPKKEEKVVKAPKVKKVTSKIK